MNPFLAPDRQNDLVLASASPRRRDLLAGLGFEFECLVSDYEESEDDRNPDPAAPARRHALGKAAAVAAQRPGALVIGADTVVVAGAEILGKPADAAAARRMLARLAAGAHRVITGVALVRYDPACAALREHCESSETTVHFRDLSAGEIETYVASGEAFDKAGGYGIQGLAAQFVTGIEGCYFNVMGLPLELLTRMIRRW